jgi:hypothetical protein
VGLWILGRAVVLLKALLSNSVERQCRHRAVEARHGYAPGAYGAAPAGETIAISPYHAFHWIGPFVFRIEVLVEHGQNTQSAEHERCPHPSEFLMESTEGEVTEVVHGTGGHQRGIGAGIPQAR